MVNRIQKLIKPSIFLSVFFFTVCCLIKKPLSTADIVSYIGHTVSAVTIVFLCYEKHLWKWIPWNRPPVLKKQYTGVIKYKYKKKEFSKPITVEIKQTWMTVRVKTRTDINSSSSITADIVSENNQDILYYSYVTNPSAINERKNPIQHGTCRMLLNSSNEELEGKYWTSSQTTGDIHWTESKE